MIPKPKRWNSKKWRDAAKDQPCTLRLSCCNGNPETTVLAHPNGAGMALKWDDFMGADSCSSCHDAIDGRVKAKETKEEIARAFQRGVFETIRNRLGRKVFK